MSKPVSDSRRGEDPSAVPGHGPGQMQLRVRSGVWEPGRAWVAGSAKGMPFMDRWPGSWVDESLMALVQGWSLGLIPGKVLESGSG